MKETTMVALIVISMAVAVSISSVSVNYAMSKITDPATMCFAQANGKDQMEICKELAMGKQK